MVLVKCKACTKRYDYHEYGCCPECGAYNRPPQRNRVGADGVVHHMSDADFLGNSHKRRSSQSGKVCFEQDVCFEDQARKVRSSAQKWAKTAENQFTRGTRNRDSQKKRGPGKILTIVVIVILVTNILPLLLTMCSISDVFEEITDTFFTEVSISKPEMLPDIPANIDGAAEYTTNIGSTFIWWDEDAAVTEVTMDETDEATGIGLTMYRVENFDEPMIYYTTNEGWTEEAFCESTTLLDDQTYYYYFNLPDRQMGSECYAYFSGYNDDVWCEVQVPLC